MLDKSLYTQSLLIHGLSNAMLGGGGGGYLSVLVGGLTSKWWRGRAFIGIRRFNSMVLIRWGRDTGGGGGVTTQAPV